VVILLVTKNFIIMWKYEWFNTKLLTIIRLCFIVVDSQIEINSKVNCLSLSIENKPTKCPNWTPWKAGKDWKKIVRVYWSSTFAFVSTNHYSTISHHFFIYQRTLYTYILELLFTFSNSLIRWTLIVLIECPGLLIF